MSCEPVVIFGSGGHAKVVADIIERDGRYSVAFMIDDCVATRGSEVYGYRVLGGREELLCERERSGILAAVVAIGDNSARCRIADWLEMNGFSLATAVHPSAQLGRGVTIGAGTVIMAQVAVNSDSAIGRNVILNTRCSVDHDCVVADGVHVAPGAVLCGEVRVGPRSRVWSGATVINGISIGADATVGAGAVVIHDVPDGATVVGVPAHPLPDRTHGGVSVGG